MPTPENRNNIPDDLFNKVICDDCLMAMQRIPDKSIDMILCDLPYGTTACKWDTIIPFEPLWGQYTRIVKDAGTIVLTASQPFTSALVMSNITMFKYEWIWEKPSAKGHLNAKKMPMKAHENILVFSKTSAKYYPQITSGHIRKTATKRKELNSEVYRKNTQTVVYDSTFRYPRSVQIFKQETQTCSLHPTQKPVALFEYLIKTYTNEGDIVLDNCAGSGTTGVACKNTNRNFILIEKEPKYVEIIHSRLSDKITKPSSERQPGKKPAESPEAFSEISFDDV